MPSRTKTGLNLADRNSYVRVEENINDNLLKIDDDVDATWGGLYGGYIQDETVVKEVGKRYIDKFNKKAYICRKASNVNTEDAYTECNVVSNLDKLQNLQNLSTHSINLGEVSNLNCILTKCVLNFTKLGNVVCFFSSGYIKKTSTTNVIQLTKGGLNIPNEFRPRDTSTFNLISSYGGLVAEYEISGDSFRINNGSYGTRELDFFLVNGVYFTN